MRKLIIRFFIFLITFYVFNSNIILAKEVSEEPKGYVPLTELETVFSNVLNYITVLAGFAILLMLVVGSFRYMVAQGDPKAITAARSQLTWSILGLFFIVAAWLIILFMEQFTGVPLTTFCINLSEIGGEGCPSP